MQEFIIEIVKSDEIYRKIANASLEKKDDMNYMNVSTVLAQLEE